MQLKHFLSHLILILSWCLKNIIRSWWEKFAPSYNPFFYVIQITILATARIARNTTYGGSILSMMWAAWAVWNQCELSTLQCNSKMGKPICSSRRCAKLFLLSHCCSGGNWACLPSLLWKPNRQGATHSMWAARWVRTCWEQILPCDQPNHSSRWSEVELTTKSWYSSFWDWEKSLDSGRWWRVMQHSGKNGVSRWPTTLLNLGATPKWGKASLTFRAHTISLEKDWP